MPEFWEFLRLKMVASGVRVAEALVILVVGWLLARYLAAGLGRLLRRVRIEATWGIVLGRTAYLVILLVVLLAALSALGVETTSVVALLGAAGLTVALAWQSALSHLASGLMILGFRLFRVGDQIEVLGVTGKVEDIRFFHTVLVDEKQVRIIVPNNKITDNVVKNYSGVAFGKAE